MAATQAALHARKVAAATLNDQVLELTRYKDKPNLNQRLLQSKLEKIYTYKDNLVDKHYFHGDKASLDLEFEEMLNFLTPVLDAANDIADEVEIMIEDLETNVDT